MMREVMRTKGPPKFVSLAKLSLLVSVQQHSALHLEEVLSPCLFPQLIIGASSQNNTPLAAAAAGSPLNIHKLRRKVETISVATETRSNIPKGLFCLFEPACLGCLEGGWIGKNDDGKRHLPTHRLATVTQNNKNKTHKRTGCVCWQPTRLQRQHLG